MLNLMRTSLQIAKKKKKVNFYLARLTVDISDEEKMYQSFPLPFQAT